VKTSSRGKTAFVGVIIVVVTMLCVIPILVFRSVHNLPAGPIEPGNPYGSALSVKVGQKVTDGLIGLYLGGTKDAVIDEVRPVYIGSAVKTLGAITSDPQRKMGIPMSSYSTWPPKDPALYVTRRAAGTIMHPRNTGVFPTQILIGMQVTRPGHFLRTGFWLYYHVGSDHFREFFPAEVTFCTPSAMQGDTCPFLGQGAAVK
jgi:hypothetical protein